MAEHLYLTRASRFIEADPVRGVRRSGIEYSGYNVVIALCNSLAAEKLLTHLKETTRSRSWIIAETKELTACPDVPLVKRVEILREIFPVIE